uniref:Uncharacterized protein n=1 Tax=Anguilla anguilla TaxID=7936 RepID=A0A0E9WFF7_ANGAN
MKTKYSPLSLKCPSMLRRYIPGLQQKTDCHKRVNGSPLPASLQTVQSKSKQIIRFLCLFLLRW